MSTLLAILLITRSSQNESSFTFSYPPDPAPTPRLSKPIYRKSAEIKEVQRHSSPSSEDDDAGGGATADGAGTVGGMGMGMGMGALGLKKDKGIRFVRGEEDSGSGTDSDEEEVFETFMSFDGKFRSGGGTSISGGPPGAGPSSKPTAIHSSPKKSGRSLPSESDFSTYLGLDTSALASALSPKKDLCDKKFEMVINALAFIGHPVWLGDKPLIKKGSPREGERVLGAGGTTTNGVEADEGDRSEGRGRPRTEKQILNSLRSPTKASNQNRHNQQPPSTPTQSNSTGPLSSSEGQGYRHVDSARFYRNEEQVGKAVPDAGVPRERLFLTTKVLGGEYGSQPVYKIVQSSVQRLGSPYWDLYLIHDPTGGKSKRLEAWKALEKAAADGLVKSIGVSNFGIRHLKELKDAGTTTPAVNQIEIHPWCQQREIVDYCRQEGIVVQAYCPLVRGQYMNDPALVSIANEQKKTPAQVLIRWSLQKKFSPLPKSDKEHRIKENAQVFDFSLNSEQMSKLDSLDSGKSGAISWNPVDVA